MAVTQYQPTTEFGNLFDEFFRPLSRRDGVRGMLRAPETDVIETEKEIRVVLDAPGMAPNDIELNLENNVLTVSGERRPEWTEEEGARHTWHLAERRYGKFSRSFVLPRDVDQDQIQAHFENGVLMVMIPKSERAQRRRIEIQNGKHSQEVGRVKSSK